MFISYGKKTSLILEGIAADFCLICRRAVIVSVYQIRSQEHVYNISVGKGTLIARICSCNVCESRWSLREGTIQSTIKPTTLSSFNALISETYPQFYSNNANRLERERIILRDPLALEPQIRIAMIAEAFYVLDNDVDKRAGESVDTLQESAFGCGGVALCCLVLTALFVFCIGKVVWGVGWSFIAAGLASLMMLMSANSNARAIRANIYPRLATCLAPLNPTPDEIISAIASIKCQSAKRTRLAEFLPILAEARAQIKAPVPANAC